jgi:uncharacterized protein (TIGR03118 family)
MKRGRFITRASLLAVTLAVPPAMLIGSHNASASSAAPNGTRSFVQTNLVSDVPGLALHTDPTLVNPWGQASAPGPGGSPIWVADNGAGKATVYDGAGNPFIPASANSPLVVTIAPPPSAGPNAVAAPTGQLFNTFDSTSTNFVISKNGKSGPAFFLFATEDGTIEGWNPNVDPTHAVIAVDRSTVTDPAGDVGAVYKGITAALTPAGKFLFASNFRFGTIDVFDSHFNLVESLADPTIPSGFAPFGIHNPGTGPLFVTFAKQNAAKHDDVAGQGNGFVEALNPVSGVLQRFVTRGKLDSPWAVTLAPSTFGAFGGDILVGNFGDGRVNVFNSLTGAFRGELRGHDSDPITIPGLWGLRFGNGTNGASTNSLFFSAGINHEADGLFGTIVPSS